MIKKLSLAAALLVPGIAYGGNPSADLSVHVAPVGGTAHTCGAIMGQAAMDAAAAGFDTCALYNDFTTAIPNTVGTGLPSNWLNCHGESTDTGAVWNAVGNSTVPCPAAYSQVTDPGFGNLALDMHYSAAWMVSGSNVDDYDWLLSVPTGSNTSSNIPAHAWSNGYYEITYRATSDTGAFPGEQQAFWQWTCCGTGGSFVEQDFFEDWATGGQNMDIAWDWWGNAAHYANGVNYPPHTQAAYNTFGALVTGNSANFAVCNYFNGTRVGCSNENYEGGQNGSQRRAIVLWNGIECNFSQGDISCAIGKFHDSHMYIESIKVLTCSAETTGGACLGSTYNGNFYQ